MAFEDEDPVIVIGNGTPVALKQLGLNPDEFAALQLLIEKGRAGIVLVKVPAEKCNEEDFLPTALAGLASKLHTTVQLKRSRKRARFGNL